jgi:hypothetical protein
VSGSSSSLPLYTTVIIFGFLFTRSQHSLNICTGNHRITTNLPLKYQALNMHRFQITPTKMIANYQFEPPQSHWVSKNYCIISLTAIVQVARFCIPFLIKRHQLLSIIKYSVPATTLFMKIIQLSAISSPTKYSQTSWKLLLFISQAS